MPDIFEKIEELFTEDQRSLLEYTCGTRKITIAKQLKQLYGNQFPRYPEEELLDECCLIIEEQIKPYLFALQDYDKKRASLKDPDSYKIRQDVNTDKGNIKVNVQDRDDQHLKETDILGLVKGGSGDRSRDYIGIEDKWIFDLKRNLKTDKSLNITFKGNGEDNLNIDNFLDFKADIKLKDLIKTIPTRPPIEKPLEEHKEIPLTEQPIITSFSSTNSSSKITSGRRRQKQEVMKAGTRKKENQQINKFTQSELIKRSLRSITPAIRLEVFMCFHYLFSDFPCRF